MAVSQSEMEVLQLYITAYYQRQQKVESKAER